MSDDPKTARAPSQQEIASFRRAASTLNRLGRAGLHIYLANGTLNLLNGSHIDERGNMRSDRIVESVILTNADGGDW